jgi:tRNA(His) guanylyltransferase
MTKSIDFEDLGNRSKSFEARGTNPTLIPGIPIIARMDGRAFHTFTKGLSKPYDKGMSESMIHTARRLVEEFKADLAYTQSDEITLVWKNESVENNIMFGGKTHKWISNLAAYTSVVFYKSTVLALPNWQYLDPTFDARVWQVPSLDIAIDTLLWREWDATKNAVSMAASSAYSERELTGKNTKQRIELLHEKNINFHEYPEFFKRGTYLRKIQVLQFISDEDWEAIPSKNRPESKLVSRSRVIEIDLPPLNTIVDKVSILFG